MAILQMHCQNWNVHDNISIACLTKLVMTFTLLIIFFIVIVYLNKSVLIKQSDT